MLGSYYWDNDKSNDSIESQYTSHNLNIDNDSKLLGTKMFKAGMTNITLMIRLLIYLLRQ